jgi:hypothetical protein
MTHQPRVATDEFCFANLAGAALTNSLGREDKSAL